MRIILAVRPHVEIWRAEGGLFAKQRSETGQDGASDDLGAFGGRVDAVLLDGAGDVDQVFVDHGDEGDVVLDGEITEAFVKSLDVVRSVVGRKSDAGEKHFNVRRFEGGEDSVEVLAGLVGRETAEAIVAAEFNDDEEWVGLDHRVYVRGCILGCGTAGAAVFDFVFVAALVEEALERRRPSLVWLEAVSGGDAVAVADDRGPVSGEQRGARKQQERNDYPAAYVHMNSVKLCKGRNGLQRGCVRMKERRGGIAE